MYYPGQRVGRYDLVQFLGKGPFTEVYLGKNIYVKEIQYAVKGSSSMFSEHLQLLQRRVYILSQLDHPSIVKTYPLDNLNNSEPVIGLTFAHLGSLDKRIAADNSYSLHDIIHYTLQLADALGYAHKKGFVHCNLKPQNILFDRNGSILLSDFDIPKLPFTQSQAVLQALPYKAPEQERQMPSPATDQYQLAHLIDSWLTRQRVSLQAQPEVINAFQQTLRKAQSADEAQRYPNMQVFAQELEKAMALPLPALVSTRPPVQRYAPFIRSGIVLFLLLLLTSSLFIGLSFKRQIATRLTPTAHSAASPQMLYQDVISTKPALDNPLAGSKVGQWTLFSDRFGSVCSMSNRILYLIDPSNLSPRTECWLGHLTMQDFAFQVEMHFLQTDQSQGYMAAGLLLRTNYQFFLDTAFYTCNFTIQFAQPYSTSCPYQIEKGAIILTVIVRQNTFYLYINHTYIDNRRDGQYQSGSLGVFLANTDPIPTKLEVSFTNVKVWTL